MGGLLGKMKNLVAVIVKIPKVMVTDLDLKGVNLSHVEYLATVSVDNPYPFPIPIMEISCDLKSDARVIVHVTILDPGNLKAKDKTDLDVMVKVPHNALVSLVTDISKDWDIDYELGLRLIIDIPVFGNFTIPISNKGEMKIPTLSDILFPKK